MEIIPVKNIDEVLKVALTKPSKELNGLKLTNLKKRKGKRRNKHSLKNLEILIKLFHTI